MRAKALLVVLAFAAVAVPRAFASTGTAAVPVALSAGSPYAETCGAAVTTFVGGEVEPSVAVNPLDPGNLIAAWQQDRYADGGARGTLTAHSRDGGASWATRQPPGTSSCAGGLFPRATDPWVSFGADGTAYLASLSYDKNNASAISTIVVSRSHDGGDTWTPPSVAVVSPQTILFNDKETITADPFVSGRAYLVWVAFDPATGNHTLFSRTTDWGATWSPPVPLPISVTTQAHQILVLPDGTLLDVFVRFGPNEVRAIRSTDGGATWSLASVKIGNFSGRGVVDPDTGSGIRTAEHLPSAAIGPGGVLYVTWQQNELSSSRVVVARSADGGLSWSTTTPISPGPAQVFIPTVAVGSGGEVGVLYYDFRHDVTGDSPLTTSIWFAHSHDSAATWSEVQVDGNFDFRTAPHSSGRGRFLGDYMGLVPLPDGFGAVYARSGQYTIGASDIFFARLTA